MWHRVASIHAVGAVAVVLAGCGAPRHPVSGDRLTVTVSIQPQKYFVERIGGDRVRVNVMVGPGESPATYEPKPSQLAALSRSTVYFRIRVPFEDAWLPRLLADHRHLRVVDTTEGVARLTLSGHAHDHLGGEADDAHGQDTLDPHIWLSPSLVRQQARTIAEALAETDPGHAETYRTRLKTFEAEIDELDVELRAMTGEPGRRTFLVFHPSWGYFAREYGLEMMAVEVGGQEPSAAELADLLDRARAHDIRVVFAQPEFSTATARTIAAQLGGRVVLVSPLAEDWPECLRRAAAAFAEGRRP